MQRLLILLSLFVLIGAAGRLLANLTAPVFPSPDLQPIRGWIAQRSLESKSPFDAWQSLTQLGVTEIAFECFDPEAVVLIRAGHDGQPGIAGVDDNANGFIDDVSELGATRSDDVCLAQRSGELDPDDEKTTLVLQHGAFVPVSPSELHNQPFPWRAVVTGESGGDQWSFLVSVSGSPTSK